MAGPIRKGRAKSWLDSSPLLPGGGTIAAGAGAGGRRGGTAAHLDEYSMYLAAGSGVARAMAVAGGEGAGGGAGASGAQGGAFEKWSGPKGREDGALPEGVVAAIELAKDLKAQKAREEHAARMAADKARKEAEEKQRQAEIEYRSLFLCGDLAML